jgi:protein-S-isoprenylcysteine O-methyltransferase Ste14
MQKIIAGFPFKDKVRLFLAMAMLVALILIPSASFYVWQAWVYVAILAGSGLLILLYLTRHDPDLLRRRLEEKERVHGQKLFRRISGPLWILGFVTSGLDHRLDLSSWFGGPVPGFVTVISDVLLVCAFYLLFRVLRFNTFASSTVQVEAGQRVISSGPYRMVRHPMYSGFVMIYCLTPLALGSYAAVPIFFLLIPTLLYRLVEEEKFLDQELPGYPDYRAQVRYRLIPYLL